MNTNIDLFFQIYNLGHKNSILDALMIFGAEKLIFVTFFICLLLLFVRGPKEKKAFILMIISFLFSQVLVQIIHLFIFEPRPYLTFNLVPLIKHIPDAAFPSGHTTIMATIAFAYLFCKSKFTVIFVVSLLWVGFARIYVGVHYPFDILGGIVVGLFAVLLSLKFKQLFYRYIL